MTDVEKLALHVAEIVEEISNALDRSLMGPNIDMSDAQDRTVEMLRAFGRESVAPEDWLRREQARREFRERHTPRNPP